MPPQRLLQSRSLRESPNRPPEHTIGESGSEAERRSFDARVNNDGTFRVAGLRCVVDTAVYHGTAEAELLLPRHALIFGLERESDVLVEDFVNRPGGVIRRRGAADECAVLPRGHRYTANMKGCGSQRFMFCELEDSTFARVLGGELGDVDLRPHLGPNPMAPGLVERLVSICLSPDDFPLAYTEAVAAMLFIELLRSHGTKAIPVPRTSSVGAARFRLVLDFVEEHLDHDIGLIELASLVGLSVTHFSHAFKRACGVSPYRYILQRRVERAQTLLRTTDDSVTAIASRVGFSTPLRFSAVFAKHVGVAPSAYRSAAGVE